MSTPARSAATWRDCETPPKIVVTFRPQAVASGSMAAVIWVASSRVGASTRPGGCLRRCAAARRRGGDQRQGEGQRLAAAGLAAAEHVAAGQGVGQGVDLDGEGVR